MSLGIIIIAGVLVGIGVGAMMSKSSLLSFVLGVWNALFGLVLLLTHSIFAFVVVVIAICFVVLASVFALKRWRISGDTKVDGDFWLRH